MAKNIVDDKDEIIESSESKLSRTENFIEDNKKSLSIIIIAILVIVGGYLGYRKFYVAPMEDEATKDMFVAEMYFEKDSFKLALNGDGNYPGFLKIIDNYGVTKAGNLAEYYAGICCLRLGQFQEAIDHLQNFDNDDMMISTVALGAIGDAYLELGKTDEAIESYLKASKNHPNKFLTPFYLMKAGMAYEEQSKWDKALEIYKQVDNDYQRTNEGRKIEKYITRAKFKGNIKD